MSEYPFKLPDHRFDQRNEMFKRSWQEEQFEGECSRFYKEAKFQDKTGYRKQDYALRNASWNIEWSAAFGNSCSNHGLYAWEGIPEKVRHVAEAGGPVKASPQEMNRDVKRAAHFFGADLVGILIKQKASALNKMILWGEELCGYGKPYDSDKF
jgi:hypothetical protein